MKSVISSLRPWATPLTVATTLVTLVTGVLLFFHISPGLTRLGHEWIGMAMLAGVAAHMILNWRAFTTYFKRPVGAGLMALGVVATALTFVISPTESGGGSPVRMIMQTMNGAEVQTLAELAHKDLSVVLEDLNAMGVSAEADDTLALLSGGQRDQEMAILTAILGE